MSNARILDHTTITQSEELTADWAGDMVPKSVTIEGIVFTIDDPMAGYVNEDLKLSLYLEGTEDGSEFWYAEAAPFES